MQGQCQGWVRYGWVRYVVGLVCLGWLCSARVGVASPDPAGAAQQYVDIGKVHLDRGGVIHGCRMGYRFAGRSDAQAPVVVFIPWHTGTSGDAAAVLGPARWIDTERFRVLVLDPLGNGVSCSPSNSRTQHGARFPQFDVRDMVAVARTVMVEHLKLTHVHALVGYSLGAMQALQWAVSYPYDMDKLVVVAGTPRPTAIDTMTQIEVERAITEEPAYRKGYYRHTPPLPVVDLLMTQNFSSRAERAEHKRYAILERQPSRQVNGGGDANDFLWQWRAVMMHDVAGKGDTPADLRTAASMIRAEVHILHGDQDGMVDPAADFAFAVLLGVMPVHLSAYCGHDVLSCEADQVAAQVRMALDSGRRDVAR